MLITIVLFIVDFSKALAVRNRCCENADKFVFPGPISDAVNLSTSSNKLMKSIELAKRISKLDKEEEFLQFFKILPSESSYSIASIGKSFDSFARSNSLKPKPAMCVPELEVVKTKENPDPAAIYFPNCIRVKRCSGCCNHELLSCQPTAVEIRNYEIHVKKLADESSKHSAFKEIVPLEEHTACMCDCKIKKKDCSDKHDYNYEECKCICRNFDEEEKCSQLQERKYWKADSCSCQCRNVEECSTGFYFDQNFCSCKNLPIMKHWLNDEIQVYSFKQAQKSKETLPIIVTIDASDYRRKHKEDPENK